MWRPLDGIPTSASLRDVLLAPREELGGATLGASLLAVHRSYLAEFRALREVAAIHSIAHLTGGGWEGNVPRSLPDGTAASIDRASWEVPAILPADSGMKGGRQDVGGSRWSTRCRPSQCPEYSNYSCQHLPSV